MENDRERIEQTLYRLLDYRAEHDVDHDSLLIMLSLLNLMGLVNALNRGGTGASSAGHGNLQSLLPLLAIAAGMGGGPGGKPGGQINPAALLGLLGGIPGGGQNDLTAILSLLGPLMGMGTQGQAAPGRPPGAGEKTGSSPKPVQREINLDRKSKPADLKSSKGKKNEDEVNGKNDIHERPPGNDGVLEWKFGGG